MIPANELRVGNFVMFTTEQKDYVIEVENIYSDGINGSYSSIFEEEDIEATFEELEPIPLMPELLEKCGFVRRSPTSEKCNIWDHKTLTTLAYFKETEDWTLLACPCARTFKYVHQLQNIWFALKDEELQVTL